MDRGLRPGAGHLRRRLRVGGDSRPQYRAPDVTVYVLIALGAAPYAFRRRWPLPVLVLASIPVLALLALGTAPR